MAFLTFSNVVADIKEGTPGHCSATSIVGAVLKGLGIGASGGHCEITCVTPDRPHCKAGTFGVDCHCDVGGKCPQRIIRPIPDYIDQFALNIANDFIVFCRGYGSSNLTSLASICTNVVSAVQSNDTDSYSYWEDQFDLQYDNLSQEEVAAIDNWIANYGH